MADIPGPDRRRLERLFAIGGGYVLDFSNRTFAERFEEVVRCDIHAPEYADKGDSKANRLRCYRAKAPAHLVGKVVNAIIDHGEEKSFFANQRPIAKRPANSRPDCLRQAR